MAGDDDFELWLGHVGDKGGGRSFAGKVRRATNLAGGVRRSGSRRFDGSRIGRGAGIGRVLGSSDRFAGKRARRVIVKARIVKLAGKGAVGAVAHLRYLQRDSTTREGERGALYGPDAGVVDGKAFLERGQGDRHQFRFIVAAEDGAEYEDLKPMIRRLMTQAEQDLGTKLDWVAVDHFNTGHPHSHVIVRGTDDRGKDLIIAREYMTQGFRQRAAEIVNLDLGPRTDLEIMVAERREMTQERFTSIDRRLLNTIDNDGLVSPSHHDPIEQSFRAGRLQALGRMELAIEERKGHWRLDDRLEEMLKAMGRRGDIIATLHRQMRDRDRSVSPADYAVFDPAEGKATPIVGRVVAHGLSDEYADRHYLIVDGVDGRSHYADIGVAPSEPIGEGMIVRLAPRPVTIRQADRTVAEVAAANGGRYNVDIHLRHDPNAREEFAEAHVRRLESIRRGTGGVTREPNGTWIIARDHLERAEAYERSLSKQAPVMIETLSRQPLDRLTGHDGATWLDRELISPTPEKLERGFGAETRVALATRRQWLIEQGLAEQADDSMRYRANLIAILQRRELTRTARQLSQELGLDFAEARQGEAVAGKLARSVTVGDKRYALIEKSREFTLLPWKPVLEKQIGRTVEGIIRGDGVSWTIGRSRGIEIS
jgi:type IV secretory pathway VirD2 relaxase